MGFRFVCAGLLPGLFASSLMAASIAPALELRPWAAPASAEAAAFVPASLGGGRVLASEQHGLLLTNAKGQELGRLKGSFTALDTRSLGQQLLLATLDNATQQPMLVPLQVAQKTWGAAVHLPQRDFEVTGLCLSRDESSNLYLFLVGEAGRGEQWWVGNGDTLSAEPKRVRGVPLPPDAGYCQVDDRSQQLFVNESSVGWWAYPAHPEARDERVPVAIRAPFGDIRKLAGPLFAVPGGLAAIDPKARELHLYQQQGDAWEAVKTLALPEVRKPEWLALQATPEGFDLLLQDDADGSLRQGHLDWQPTAQPLPAPIAVVQAAVQTEPVARQGDAADDPAIWVHPQHPAASRVLGTNKKQGLLVYDLQGRLKQELAVGRLNNVDVRAGFDLGGRQVDLAVATHRDHNSLALFSIDRQSGDVQPIGEVPTPLKAIYGMCLYQAGGQTYAFANDKDGTFLQYRLSAAGGQVKGEMLRSFKLDSQPEGCVADDRNGRLFVGEEDVGVWALDARPGEPATLASVIKVGNHVHADVEGLALYQKGAATYLVISSQGNDSYVLLDAQPPYALRGAVRVGLNGAAGIDGSSETDGIEVTSANLGGPFGEGLLVVQDGRKRMPEQAQNFKLVPWAPIRQALGLP